MESDDRILDIERARYLVTHLEQAARAIEDGSANGLFRPTLMDNFEWAAGFDALRSLCMSTSRRNGGSSGKWTDSMPVSLTPRSCIAGALKRLGGDIGIS